jgi:predicted Ser/Thr protein kinase
MAHPESLGKYAITGVLGEGAMGVVYKAFDPLIQRPVAIKTVHRQLLVDDSFAARFRNEAQAAGRLSHPGIVAVYDYGEADGTAFIAMEFVEGRSLAQILAATPVPSESDILCVMDQLLAALDCAHAAGVWHRDIKPANLLLTSGGQLKVSDFGVARIDSQALTHTTAIVGTPGYIAPEQYLGKPLDHRVDLFAAGVLLYRMLAGRAPFSGPPEALMYRTVHEDPPPPSRIDGSRSPQYDAVVALALAREPDARYASAAQFRHALKQAGGAPGAEFTSTLVRASPTDSAFAATLPGSRPAGSGGTLLAATTIGGWDAAALAPIETALARVLGPMARLLVRQAALECTDLAVLAGRMAEHITDEKQRARFFARAASGRTLPSASVPPAEAARPLSPEVISHALRVLTAHMGPIARIVVKCAAAQAQSSEQFHLLLAEEAAEGVQRQRLLRKLQRG